MGRKRNYNGRKEHYRSSSKIWGRGRRECLLHCTCFNFCLSYYKGTQSFTHMWEEKPPFHTIFFFFQEKIITHLRNHHSSETQPASRVPSSAGLLIHHSAGEGGQWKRSPRDSSWGVSLLYLKWRMPMLIASPRAGPHCHHRGLENIC